jgi:hypothetical protein
VTAFSSFNSSRITKQQREAANHLYKYGRIDPRILEEQTRIEEAKFGFQQSDILKKGYGQIETLNSWTDGAFNLSAHLISKWTQAVSNRRDYRAISTEIRQLYMVKRLLELIAMDVLNPDENGDVVKLISTEGDEDLQEELDTFEDNVDLDILLQDNIINYIEIGEMSIKTIYNEGEGLVEYYDDVDPLNVLAFYERGVPTNYLMMENSKFLIKPADCYAHFLRGSRKINIKTDDSISNEFGLSPEMKIPQNLLKVLPDYIRIGEPFFLGMITKLRELQLLEQLIPAMKLNELTQSQLVAMMFPPTMPLAEVKKAMAQMEGLLNCPTGIDFEQNQISIAEILTAAGHMRVYPEFTDGKGKMTTNEIRKSMPVDDVLAAVQDIRGVISSSLGVPPSLLFGAAMGEGDKLQELKQHGAYNRSLASIRQSLTRGIRQMVLGHLVNRGLKVRARDFKVVFPNSLVDVSGLEKLEFIDAKNEILMRLLTFVTTLMQDQLVGPTVNKKGMIEFVQKQINMVADGADLFIEEPESPRIRVKRVADALQDLVVKLQPVEDDQDSISFNLTDPENDIAGSDGSAQP